MEVFKKLRYFNIDIDFNVNSEVLVIQGPSGAGKTTLLDCISGIREPDKGCIVLNGRVIYSYDEGRSIPVKDRSIGYVFQNYALFPHMTIRENIIFGVKSRGIKDTSYADHIIDTLGLKHLERMKPGQVSGGEKQRTALARALAFNPELLLLDEPFSALDYDTRQGIYSEFLNLKMNWDIDIILITHDEKEAEILGDRMIMIKDGVIV